jgi:hypothetical protein
MDLIKLFTEEMYTGKFQEICIGMYHVNAML